MRLALTIIALTVVPLALFLLLRPVPEFVVRIDRGKPRVIRGKAPGRFVSECAVICTEWKVISGSVKGVRVSGRVALRFSQDIPAQHHQRFRNAL